MSHQAAYKALSGLPTNAADAQAKRRIASLALIKQRRQTSFDLFRSASYAALELDDSDSEDAAVQALSSQASKMDLDQTQRTSKWSRFANKLTWAELLPVESAEALQWPDWIASVVPVGKRCLVLSYHTVQRKQKYSQNCLLLARATGRPITRLLTALPPGCTLDCIWDAQQRVLWVLDVIEWACAGLSESDTEMRFFWKASKLQELGPQPYSEGQIGKQSLRALILPAPNFDHLSRSSMQQALAACLCPTLLPLSVVHLDQTPAPSLQNVTVNLQPAGLLLHHRDAFYICGETALSLWLPMQASEADHYTVASLQSLLSNAETMATD